MHISPTGIKISFGGRREVEDEDRPVVARIVGFASEKGAETIAHEMVVSAGQTVEQPLPMGVYNVQLTLPSGRILQRNVEIGEDSNETYEFFEDFAPGAGFSLQESAGLSDKQLIRESAAVSGNPSVDPQVKARAGSEGIFARVIDFLSSRRANRDSGVGVTERPHVPTLKVAVGIDFDDNAAPTGDAQWSEANPDEVRGSCGVWRVPAVSSEKPSLANRRWARIELPDGGFELASLPLPWFCTGTGDFTSAEILVDPSRQGGASTTVAVRDARLSGLLAFLDRGQAGAARALLEQIERSNLIEETIGEKMSNPLAACAAAYVGLSVYPANEHEQWDTWLQNCSERFPGVPDAAIVYARRLVLRPDHSSCNRLAAAALNKAMAAGPPFFSAGVALLREMLLLLSADEPELAGEADRAASLAARVDPTQVFTVLRFAPSSSASS